VNKLLSLSFYSEEYIHEPSMEASYLIFGVLDSPKGLRTLYTEALSRECPGVILSFERIGMSEDDVKEVTTELQLNDDINATEYLTRKLQTSAQNSGEPISGSCSSWTASFATTGYYKTAVTFITPIESLETVINT